LGSVAVGVVSPGKLGTETGLCIWLRLTFFTGWGTAGQQVTLLYVTDCSFKVSSPGCNSLSTPKSSFSAIGFANSLPNSYIKTKLKNLQPWALVCSSVHRCCYSLQAVASWDGQAKPMPRLLWQAPCTGMGLQVSQSKQLSQGNSWECKIRQSWE
jgi:hypothetical protein